MTPALEDIAALTLESKDIEDLKQCVVGDCDIKLSAAMMQRFAREVNWQASAARATSHATLQNHAARVCERLSLARRRGASIAYHDKQNEVRLADENQALTRASGYLNEVFAELPRAASDERTAARRTTCLVQNQVWPEPIIAINHVTIYKSDRELGPRILAVSKQIYANHYFNSSLALTGFVTVAGPASNLASYLVYENRSRADAFEGPFGKLKRNLVQTKALDGLKGILEHSKVTIETPLMAGDDAIAAATVSDGWGRACSAHSAVAVVPGYRRLDCALGTP